MECADWNMSQDVFFGFNNDNNVENRNIVALTPLPMWQTWARRFWLDEGWGCHYIFAVSKMIGEILVWPSSGRRSRRNWRERKSRRWGRLFMQRCWKHLPQKIAPWWILLSGGEEALSLPHQSSAQCLVAMEPSTSSMPWTTTMLATLVFILVVTIIILLKIMHIMHLKIEATRDAMDCVRQQLRQGRDPMRVRDEEHYRWGACGLKQMQKRVQMK